MHNSNSRGLYRATGILLLVATLGFNVFFTLLSITFEYPDILRSPTSYVLAEYQAGGSTLTLEWYGMVFVSILLIPCVVFLHRLLRDSDSPLLGLGTVCGVVAAVMNLLGFIRWIFVVPHLASRYVDAATTPTGKETIEIVFEAFHLYAGFSVGEHLGYIFLGLWAILTGAVMVRSSIFRPWLGWSGMIAGPLVIFGSLEGAGLPVAADINVIGFILWSLWLVATAFFLLFAKPQPAQPLQVAGSHLSSSV